MGPDVWMSLKMDGRGSDVGIGLKMDGGARCVDEPLDGRWGRMFG